jgi:hypothetical protein
MWMWIEYSPFFMQAPAVTSDDSAVRGERRAVRRRGPPFTGCLLFQLRLRFVHEERIGIDEITAEHILTIRLHANERQTAASKQSHRTFDVDEDGWRQRRAAATHRADSF